MSETVIYRTGWDNPVGYASSVVSSTENFQGIKFDRMELKDVRLSYSAAMRILQGDTIKNVFGDTSLNSRIDHLHIILAETPRLYKPPPMISRMVLVRILEIQKPPHPSEPLKDFLEDQLEELYFREVLG